MVLTVFSWENTLLNFFLSQFLIMNTYELQPKIASQSHLNSSSQMGEAKPKEKT